MPALSRRSVLTLFGAAPVVAASAAPAAASAAASAAADEYPTNSALYAARTEGVDYARRFRRHAALDDSDGPGPAFPDTAIVALHGGGIEPGTSELCLAVAGYHPATGAATGGAVHDYWMFEGIMPRDNSLLHVTSAHCDDPVALATVAASSRTLSLHGCTPAQAGFPDPAKAAVLVGGRDAGLKAVVIAALVDAGIDARDAVAVPALNGDDPANIVNRNLAGAGVQLELTTPLRTSMFLTNTRPGRKNTTTEVFWAFVDATRAAVTSGAGWARIGNPGPPPDRPAR